MTAADLTGPQPVPPSSVRRLDELIRWTDEFMSEPYPGPGATRPGGPICPYTRQAIADDDLFVDLRPGIDGSDLDQVRELISNCTEWYTANVAADDWCKALVVGLPDMPHAAGPAVQELMDETADWRMSHRIIATIMVNQSPRPTGTEPWPTGFHCPMPTLAYRYVSRLDFRFLKVSPLTLRAYLDSYAADYAAGTLPAVARRAVEEACREHGIPLPVGG